MKRARNRLILIPLWASLALCLPASSQPGSQPVRPSDRVEPLTMADLEGLEGDLIPQQIRLAPHDAIVARCSGARDPVLRDNAMHILKAQLGEGGDSESAFQREAQRYDRAFDMGMAQYQQWPQSVCQAITVEKAYRDFARAQEQWLAQIKRQRQAQAATPSTRSAEERCKEIQDRLNQGKQMSRGDRMRCRCEQSSSPPRWNCVPRPYGAP